MATVTKGKAARMHDPAHPGEVVRELYLDPLKITITQAAQALGVSRKHLSEIINGRASVTPDMAMRLAKSLSTDPAIWINLQAQHYLWSVTRHAAPKVKQLRSPE